MSDLKLKYYSSILLQIKRGNSKYGKINAKPILLLAVIELIDNDIVTNNRFVPNSIFIDVYKQLYVRFAPLIEVTPFQKPFLYLQSDGFWNIEWINLKMCNSITLKVLQNNVVCASLENALWDILQDKNNRKSIKDTIVKYFFTTK